MATGTHGAGDATPYAVKLSASKTKGHTNVDGLSAESAEKVSALLMLNHKNYHTLFNEVGLHNHIVHHLCSLYALGATPAELQAAYDLNQKYQLPQYECDSAVTERLSDRAFFTSCLGEHSQKHYPNFLKFFQDEIAARGMEEVVQDYLFRGDAFADDMLGRMFSGFEHPILHLGFALEFDQPCLLAESLASACVHPTWPLDEILTIEKYISDHPELPRNSMLSVVDALKNDPKIVAGAKDGSHPNRVTEVLLKNVTPLLIPVLAKWRVEPTEEDIKYRLAEMTHVCAYLSGAAQHPKKKPSIEFFMMHSTNLSVFFPVFMELEYLTLKQKARLLTWKGWLDLVMYAACGCPELYYDRISGYKPKNSGPWSNVVKRANTHPDDGHTSKFIRALINAEKVSKPLEGNQGFPLRQKDFLQIAHMCLDSVERMLEADYRLPPEGEKLYVKRLGLDVEAFKIVCRFVRWCGIDGVWDDFPDLPETQQSKL